VVLVIHIVLHPAFKLQYFRQQRCEDEWVYTAYKITEDESNSYYANVEVSAVSAETHISHGRAPTVSTTLLSYRIATVLTGLV